MRDEKTLELGRVINTHGLRGEVKAELWADGPDFLRKVKTVLLDGERRRLLSWREQGGAVLLRLEGVEDVNAAMALKNKVLRIERDAVRLPEGRFFLADLVGLRVVNEDGEELGELSEVMERPAHNVYVVRGRREHLIPAVPAFILDTDLDGGVMTVRLIEGM